MNSLLVYENINKIRKQKGEKFLLQYSLGGLLYTPGLNKKIADDICSNKYRGLKSICLCLEDSISDNSVEKAEKNVAEILKKIKNQLEINQNLLKNLPLIFIRIRNSNQLIRLYNMIKENISILTGFVLPKFDLSNSEEYKRIITKINQNQNKHIYIMPILESSSIIDLENRTKALVGIKKCLDSISDFVLNVRIGGNDFCNKFGLRRNVNQTIYDISVIRNIMSDIFNVFGIDYVVSGPVWEYFDNNLDDKWKTGLERELEMDKLNGFIGKTAIHPSQIEIINNSMAVDYFDYEDAKNIINWKDDELGVKKGKYVARMNEVKVHKNWAYKIIALANIYGIKSLDN